MYQTASTLRLLVCEYKSTTPPMESSLTLEGKMTLNIENPRNVILLLHNFWYIRFGRMFLQIPFRRQRGAVGDDNNAIEK